MSSHCVKDKDHSKLTTGIHNRENLEDKALASLISQTLQKLNITCEKLPRKCQASLEQVADLQTALQFQTLDPTTILLYGSRELSEETENEYEILELEQKNVELQTVIDRNNRFIAKLRKELELSKYSLSSQNPNPDDIEEYIRQLRQKLTAYSDSYESLKSKYLARNVPEAILPQSLKSQIASLHSLSEEAITLKEQADDVIFMKETKAKFYRLRK